MIAAIYARRSKEQDDAEDETKSVNRQVENARVFATAKGWTVLEEHIYIDDGVSGASRSTRLRAKARMLDAIMASKPFDVLICQAADRFSRRDGDESFAELKTISKAGVQVWFYSGGTCFRYGTSEAKRQQEREALLAEIATAQALDQIHADRAAVEARVQAQVPTWRTLIDTSVVSEGRQLLNEMLEGPLRFTTEGRAYRFVGPVATGRLIAGMVGLPPKVASPTGEHEELESLPVTGWLIDHRAA